jgi:putative transposase
MVQLELRPKTWGGPREGAGRPTRTRQKGDPLPHYRRLEFKRLPVHVTLRVLRDVANLRTKECFKEIKHAFRLGSDRFGMRLNEFSVQANHLHLIVEANDKESLARGLQGLAIRLAKAINRASGRDGSVFADRYHAHLLKTPSEVRNAIVYVRRNFHKHVRENTGRIVPASWRDPFSSANEEAVWDLVLENGEIVGTLVVAAPATWLLKQVSPSNADPRRARAPSICRGT